MNLQIYGNIKLAIMQIMQFVYFSQNEGISVQLDELDELDRIPYA